MHKSNTRATAAILGAMVGALIAYIAVSILLGAGGLFLSKANDGYAWTRFQVPGSRHKSWNRPSLVVTHTDAIIVASGSREGIFRGTDRGKTWQRCNKGMKRCLTWCLAVDRNGNIYAATGRGLYCSTDDGRSWTLAYATPDDPVWSIAFDEQNNVYAGTGDGHILMSTDGRHWKSIGKSRIQGDLSSIAVDSEGVIYAGTKYYGIYRTNDRGRHWEHVWKPVKYGYGVRSLVVGPQGDIWAEDGERLLHSSDSGKHWKCTKFGSRGLPCFALALSLKGEAMVGGSSGGFISRDNGKSWRRMGVRQGGFLVKALPYITSIASDKTGRVYAVSDDGSVFVGTPARSKD